MLASPVSGETAEGFNGAALLIKYHRYNGAETITRGIISRQMERTKCIKNINFECDFRASGHWTGGRVTINCFIVTIKQCEIK